MRYLHSMIRVTDLDKTLHFFCDILGFKEVRRYDSERDALLLCFCAQVVMSITLKKSRP